MKCDRLPGRAAPVLMVGRLVPLKEVGTASDSREGRSMLPTAAGSCRVAGAATMLGTTEVAGQCSYAAAVVFRAGRGLS